MRQEWVAIRSYLCHGPLRICTAFSFRATRCTVSCHSPQKSGLTVLEQHVAMNLDKRFMTLIWVEPFQSLLGRGKRGYSTKP